MNSRQRVQTVIEGRRPDRVPVSLHNFLLACKESGVPMEKYRTDPQAIARAHLDALDRYGHDSLLVDLDTTLLAEAMGATAECTPGEPGHIARAAIQSLEEVDRLKPADPEKDGRIPALLEAVRILDKAVGTEVSIRGNADQGAFSLACLVRGMQEFLMDIASDPDDPAIGRLLEVCYQTHLATHRALKRAGAHITSLGDSPAGPDVLSPKMFERFARPYEERLVRDLAADEIFTVIHICGDTTKILRSLAQYDACGFELDYKTDATLAKQTAGNKHVLFGNIDPSGVIARGTVGDVKRKTRELIELWKPGGFFILNSGCAIPSSAPSENIRAFIQTAHETGSYE